MTTLYVTHPACTGHDPGAFHPESPERLRAIWKGLDTPAFRGLDRREAPPGSRDAIGLVHREGYAEAVLEAVPKAGFRALDPDTILSPGSGEAALRAVGAVCAAVDAVSTGTATNAFCAVRPPGHHAEADRPMGFCLFNNVAIGALHARAAHGFGRVAVVDFDVHHGNGTQHRFERDPDLFFASTHRGGIFPGSGRADETGVGNVVNVPLPAGAGSKTFRAAMERHVLPALDAFAPAFILLSAGFDAHRADPLGGLAFDSDDFHWVTAEIARLAERHAGGRIVSCLEGGYDLGALAESAAAHVRALLEASR